ncbi:MAG: hypothetical protein WCZ18_03555 [Ottowia sp.]|nr:hypothetical protein [Ottowia sp.]
MTWGDLFWHLAGFLAPALVLAPAMVLACRLLGWRPALKLGWMAQVGVNFAACVLVLAFGLALTGEDGRIATYTVLVMVSAGCQWLLTRPGKRKKS